MSQRREPLYAKMGHSVDTQTLIHRLESNELAAYHSIYQAPSADVARQLGLGWLDYDGVLLVWNRAAPTFLFNRVLALGLFKPATDETGATVSGSSGRN